MFITRTNDTLPSVKLIYTSNTLVFHHHVEQYVKHGFELYLLRTQLSFFIEKRNLCDGSSLKWTVPYQSYRFKRTQTG